MDSLQSLPSDQRHRDEFVSLVPGPAAAKTWPAEPMWGPDGQYVLTAVPELIDVSAEETCPAPGAQLSAQDDAPQLESAVQTAQAPSATTFELMNQLEALAADVADKGRASSDQHIETVREVSDFSAGPQATEPSIRVPPRPSSFESDQFAIDKPPMGKRTGLTLAGLCAVALIGGTFGWQSYRASTATPPNEVNVVTEQPRSVVPATQASAPAAALPQPAPVVQTVQPPPVIQTAPVPAAPPATPEIAKQLEAMAQDIAVVRRGVEQLAAKQEQLAGAQQRLEQLATKQEQMAQNIAKLQTREQNIRPKVPPAPQSRAASIPPRVSAEPPAQLSPAPASRFSEPHPLPPLPVPP